MDEVIKKHILEKTEDADAPCEWSTIKTRRTEEIFILQRSVDIKNYPWRGVLRDLSVRAYQFIILKKVLRNQKARPVG